jgi:hypothetical protein
MFQRTLVVLALTPLFWLGGPAASGLLKKESHLPIAE